MRDLKRRNVPQANGMATVTRGKALIEEVYGLSEKKQGGVLRGGSCLTVLSCEFWVLSYGWENGEDSFAISTV